MGINYPALLVNQITLPPYSQTLVDVTTQITNAKDLIFEPYGNHISKYIFTPHTLLNINDGKAKILLINGQNRQQTLSKNTRIGTISRDATFSIFTTAHNSNTSHHPSNENVTGSFQHSRNLPNRAVACNKDNSSRTTSDTYCHQCNEYFLSGNDLQKHLREQCYSEQIRKQIIESTTHIENRKTSISSSRHFMAK